MAQNFLYNFEFVVDDLLITRPNRCAPEEYPTCCEITFRSSFFISICDRKYGQCKDPCDIKCGKCCLFALDSPITDDDRLYIHIYKKRFEKCKFLVGATEVPVKAIFDKVTEDFNAQNPGWIQQLARHTARLPDPKEPKPIGSLDDDEDDYGRQEQLCPTSQVAKQLLPLFNMQKKQTGNIIIVMRLTCFGPTLVTSFPYGVMCPCDCPCEKPKKKSRCKASDPCSMPDPCVDIPYVPCCRRYFNCNDCYPSDCYLNCPKNDCPSSDPCICLPCKEPKPNPGRVCCSSKKDQVKTLGNQQYCGMPDPCEKPQPPRLVCRRYFNCDCNCDAPPPCCVECPKPCKKSKPKCCKNDANESKDDVAKQLRYLFKKYSCDN